MRWTLRSRILALLGVVQIVLFLSAFVRLHRPSEHETLNSCYRLVSSVPDSPGRIVILTSAHTTSFVFAYSYAAMLQRLYKCSDLMIALLVLVPPQLGGELRPLDSNPLFLTNCFTIPMEEWIALNNINKHKVRDSMRAAVHGEPNLIVTFGADVDYGFTRWIGAELTLLSKVLFPVSKIWNVLTDCKQPGCFAGKSLDRLAAANQVKAFHSAETNFFISKTLSSSLQEARSACIECHQAVLDLPAAVWAMMINLFPDAPAGPPVENAEIACVVVLNDCFDEQMSFVKLVFSSKKLQSFKKLLVIQHSPGDLLVANHTVPHLFNTRVEYQILGFDAADIITLPSLFRRANTSMVAIVPMLEEKFSQIHIVQALWAGAVPVRFSRATGFPADLNVCEHSVWTDCAWEDALLLLLADPSSYHIRARQSYANRFNELRASQEALFSSSHSPRSRPSLKQFSLQPTPLARKAVLIHTIQPFFAAPSPTDMNSYRFHRVPLFSMCETDVMSARKAFQSDPYISMLLHWIRQGHLVEGHVIFLIPERPLGYIKASALFPFSPDLDSLRRITLWHIQPAPYVMAFKNADFFFLRGRTHWVYKYLLDNARPSSFFALYEATSIEDSMPNIKQTYQITRAYDLVFYDSPHREADWQRIHAPSKVQTFCKPCPDDFRNLRLPTRPYDFIFAGRSDGAETKRLHLVRDFLEWVDTVPNQGLSFRFAIVADLSGSFRRWYEGRSWQRVKVDIFGWLEAPQLVHMFNSARNHLISSSIDANPRVISQAAMCGTFNIATTSLSDGVWQFKEPIGTLIDDDSLDRFRSQLLAQLLTTRNHSETSLVARSMFSVDICGEKNWKAIDSLWSKRNRTDV